MSLVIALRKDDVVYFGSDSQLTSGTSKNNLNTWAKKL